MATLQKLVRATIALIATTSAVSTALAQSTYEPYAITTFAGTPGRPGLFDGTGTLPPSPFYNPGGVAQDSAGNLYVASTSNHIIRKITPDGTVSTLAGLEGVIGSVDGVGSAARFDHPRGLAADSVGNVYVADTFNHTIRRITSGGVVSTLAGSAGNAGGDDGTGSAARFNYPTGVAADGAGNVYVGDTNNDTIRQITSGGVVSTLAGLVGAFGSDDGTGSAARFCHPRGVALDTAGNVYVADYCNSTVRKITSGGVVSTLAGLAGNPGSIDGTGSAARFNIPTGVAVDSSAGNVYVADSGNDTIRQITSGGVVTTLAGSAGNVGSADGTGSAARFYHSNGVGVNGVGNVYVADTENHAIRKVAFGGVVTTVAGYPGFFSSPSGVAVDIAGTLYVADQINSTIRQVTSGGVVSTLAGLAGATGSADGTGSVARFYLPSGVAADSAGNVYVADTYNSTIRKVTSGGVVTTLAGLAGAFGSVDGTGSAARFNYPTGVTVDSAGTLYVADRNNDTIRKVTSDGVVSTLAGLAGNPGSSDGVGSTARFDTPMGVAVDSAGNVYVADTNNSTMRKITSGGVVSTLAGLAGATGSADGTGSAARFNYLGGVGLDNAGNVYVADRNNETIRKVTSGGVVSTLAGLAGAFGIADGTGSAARFNYLTGVAISSSGTLYVADTGNHAIRAGAPALALATAVSRKVHGSAGTFDIDLPLTGSPGVECRSSSGSHTLVFTASNNLVSGNASVTTGIGSVSGSPTFSGNTMTVNLTGVTDVQKITVTLSNVTDSFAQTLPDTPVSVNMLIGDATGNRSVNASDINRIKTQTGLPVTLVNFRADINASGSVTASDVAQGKLNSGHTLP